MLVRVFMDEPESVRTAWEGRGLDITEMQPGRSIDVVAAPSRLGSLLDAYADQIHSVEPRDWEPYEINRAKYKTPSQIVELLDRVETEHPLVATKHDLTPYGLWEGGHLLAMRLTSPVSKTGPKPSVLFTGRIHGGEVMTSEVTTDIVDYLASNYGKDPKVTNWLDRLEVWVIPVVNVEGASDFSRNNANPNGPVNLNRNFPATWGACEGPTEADKGFSPGSEPETQAVGRLLSWIKPRFHIDYHSNGGLITYPGGCGPVPHADELDRIARGMRAAIAAGGPGSPVYAVGRLEELVNPISGSLMDETYAAYGAMSFLVELPGEFTPDYDLERDAMVKHERPGWQYLLDEAAAPHVRGQIKEAGTGLPLEARVRVQRNAFEPLTEWLDTDTEGRFEVALHPLQAIEVVAEASGYKHRVVPVDLGRDDVALSIELEPSASENRPPVVQVAAEVEVNEGDMVRLEAAAVDPDGDALRYRWTQDSSRTLSLEGVSTAVLSFRAPVTYVLDVWFFQIEVSDGREISRASVRVLVRNVWSPATYCSSVPVRIDRYRQADASAPIHVATDATVLAARAELRLSSPEDSVRVEIEGPDKSIATSVTTGQYGGASVDLSEFLGGRSGGDWRLRFPNPTEAAYLLEWRLELEVAGTLEPGDDDQCRQLCETDSDGDGFLSSACGGDDCDDANEPVNPSSAEYCDRVDNDCDGVTDEACIQLWQDPSCGCASSPSDRGLPWLLVLAALGARTRRDTLRRGARRPSCEHVPGRSS